MAENTSIRFLQRFEKRAPAPRFLSSFFQSPPENFHKSEELQVDIMRDSEKIAIPVQGLSVGPRENAASTFETKRFKPPVFKESGTLNGFDLTHREFGMHAYESPEFGAAASRAVERIWVKMTQKIQRSVELQASQALFDGAITLTDEDGDEVYNIDFQKRAELHITPSTPWHVAGTAGDPYGDISGLGDAVRQYGLTDPTDLVFGKSAMARFLINPKIIAELERRRQDTAFIKPEKRMNGATYRGSIWIDHYEYRLWMYNGGYIEPASGDRVPYVPTNKMLMLSEGARLDLAYGDIPRIVAPEGRVLSFLPQRITAPSSGVSFSSFAYVTPNGEHLKVEVGTRPLAIPTEIDSFGTLTVA